MTLRRVAFVFFIFISGVIVGESLDLFKRDFPKNIVEVNRLFYSLGYDFRTRNALWVYECLTAECLKGDTSREGIIFKEDPLIPAVFRSCVEDFKNSGFDRGHLAPAGNHKNNPEQMKDTFYLSNVCPQNPNFNRGYWAKLEKHVRDLTNSYETVEVFTGSLYLPKEEEDGTRWVKYQVIGNNDVAVPTHFYKVIFLESSGNRDVLAYVLPNEPIAQNTPLDQFRTTAKKVEKASGVLFSTWNNLNGVDFD